MLAWFGLAALWMALAMPAARAEIAPSISAFCREMPRTVRADHPAIVPIAAAIRAVTTDPLQQLVMVNDVTHLLIDYDDDARVYGRPEFFATLDEMIAKRRDEGWVYLRDDCDGRAVFAAHLLAALDIPWKLTASRLKHHAWVIARVGGVDYDLLDFRPDHATPKGFSGMMTRLFVRESHRPPSFDWREAWVTHTNRDLNVGLRLGMVTLDSTPSHLVQRYARDWTVLHPDGDNSPRDDSALAASCAGFPYGEQLIDPARKPLPMIASTAAVSSEASVAAPSSILQQR